MTLQSVKKSVLKIIKPDEKEEYRINQFVFQIMGVAEVVSKARPIIVGSLGRGTWLKGDHDVDLFLMFDKTLPREALEKIGMENAKEVVSQMKGKFIIKYAEHPYVRANFNDIQVDIVPCYQIKPGEKIISAVDRSPLHVEYVLQRLTESMRDEVRLLKQFCKGIGVYGSDAKNLGISGYICELLVIKYGSFENSLKMLSKLEPGSKIDLENHWDCENEKENAKHLMHMFKNNPLIVIDPVDKNRNVASALSCENFIKLCSKSKEFIKKPGLKYFLSESKPLASTEINKLSRRKTKFFAISFKKPDVIDDILYPQLRKTQERLSTLLRHNEFRIIRNEIFVDEKSDKAFLIFEMECWELPFINNMIGPPIFDTKNSKDFLKKYQKPLYGPYVSGNNWIIDKERVYKSADEAVVKFLKRNPKELHDIGIPEYIAKDISKFKLLQHKDFWNVLRKNKELSIFIREIYLEHF